MVNDLSRLRPIRLALLLSIVALGAWGQTTQPPATPPAAPPVATPPADPNQPEMTTKDAPATFKTRVSLVMVPVVVRDNKGKTVGTLKMEDFQLFDKGKPQTIIKFSAEKSGPKPVLDPPTAPALVTEDQTPPPDIPERFIAYLFDDQHLEFGDLVRSRDAALRHLSELKITDRAAIYTTSGQNIVEFTDDKEKLRDMLMKIRPRSMSQPGGVAQCPDISYYMADMMINKNDPTANQLAVSEVQACIPNLSATAAAAMARGAASAALSIGSQETRVTLSVLTQVVRRMSGMPGQRIILMVSPGFLTPSETSEKMDVLDRAIKGSVVINSLDARGLWVDPMLDVSRPSNAHTTQFVIMKSQYDRDAASAQADVLAEMAHGTGGSFFQNNNDLDEGFRRLATAPEFYYLLGFSPQNLKLDGTFHNLKVTLTAKARVALDVQARKGYYAPKKLSDAAETAKQEIEEALFSREEMNELPVELHTQFFKTSEKDATLAVVCRMDPKHIPFRKADGRNNDTITIVSGIFDRNGNFISGLQKVVDLRLKDETLTKLATVGMAVKTNFSVNPGTYMVRLVVRDSEGQLMSAANGAVAIP
jgi:VWFA-related protein